MTEHNGEWGTSVLALAATVKTLGAEYVRTDKTIPRSMVFYFCAPTDPTGLDKILGTLNFNFDEVERDFTNGKIRVNPKLYYNSLQDLKSVIHSSH